MRLGEGGLRTEELELREVRMLFLRTIEAHASEVLERLNQIVYPAFAELANQMAASLSGRVQVRVTYRAGHGIQFKVVMANDEAQPPPASATSMRNARVDVDSLERALFAWRDEVHLYDDWCLDTALHTLTRWYRCPHESRTSWIVPHVAWWGFSEEAQERSRRRELRWDPPTESRSAAKNRILRTLDDYLDSRSEAAQAQGWRPPTRNNPRTTTTREVADPERPFQWLVAHQVRNRTYQQIADEAGVSRQAATEAIKKTGARIRLTPRGRGGRTDRRD